MFLIFPQNLYSFCFLAEEKMMVVVVVVVVADATHLCQDGLQI